MDVSGGTVVISIEKLKELEALASKAASASKYIKRKNVCKLRAYHNNKEEINAKRRAAYKAKKEAEAAAAAAEGATA